MLAFTKVPTRTPVKEKLEKFEQTGKVREKSWKIRQNTGKLKDFETNVLFAKIDEVFSLKKNKALKKYWNNEKKRGKIR